ncbi:MAG TPA: acyl carrier protein [bacterium]|nr:acyl carrier protein [bacterium]
MSSAVEQRVKAIIAEQLGVSEDEVGPSDLIVDDLGADSVDIAELIMALEEEFEVDISDEDAEKMRSVKDTVDYVRKTVP